MTRHAAPERPPVQPRPGGSVEKPTTFATVSWIAAAVWLYALDGHAPVWAVAVGLVLFACASVCGIWLAASVARAAVQQLRDRRDGRHR